MPTSAHPSHHHFLIASAIPWSQVDRNLSWFPCFHTPSPPCRGFAKHWLHHHPSHRPPVLPAASVPVPRWSWVSRAKTWCWESKQLPSLLPWLVMLKFYSPLALLFALLHRAERDKQTLKSKNAFTYRSSSKMPEAACPQETLLSHLLMLSDLNRTNSCTWPHTWGLSAPQDLPTQAGTGCVPLCPEQDGGCQVNAASARRDPNSSRDTSPVPGLTCFAHGHPQMARLLVLPAIPAGRGQRCLSQNQS